jgi:cysteine desulfuration protein SufE
MTLRTFSQIKEDFDVLDLWEDRYRYLLDLGKALEPLPESFYTSSRKVSGCVSQLWLEVVLESSPDGGKVVRLRGDSDAHIVRGLAALVFSLYDNSTPEHALTIDAFSILNELNLENHLTPQRSNGLHALIARIRSDIQKKMHSSSSDL